MCYCSINAHFTNYDQYLSILYSLKSNTEQLISSCTYAKKLTQLSQLTCIIHVRYNCTYTLYVFLMCMCLYLQQLDSLDFHY